MPKSIKSDLSKVNKLLHPKSRKVAKLSEKANRLDARQQIKKRHQMKDNLIGEKLKWFKERLDPNAVLYTKEMLLKLIEEYLARFNDELEQINIVHSMKNRGRRYASREDAIKNTLKQEELEFNTCGFEVPDLLNPKIIILLREWNEELRFLPHFRWQRYTRKYLQTPSKATKSEQGSIAEANNTDSSLENVENSESEEEEEEEEEEEMNDTQSDSCKGDRKSSVLEENEASAMEMEN